MNKEKGTFSRKNSKKKPSQQKNSHAHSIASTPRFSFWHYILPPSVLSLLTFAFYYPSLKYPFQFDDLANISKNFSIRSSYPFPRWPGGRVMGEWLNNLNFQIARFDPFYYRMINVFIHILAGIFLFFIILEACRYLKKSPFLSKNALLIAFSTSALFMLHPVQTQSVSYAIQARHEGLAGLFAIAGIFFLLKALQSTNIFLRIILIFPSMVIGFYSCGTKDIAIIAPALGLVLDWFIVSEQEWNTFKKHLWLHGLYIFSVWGTYMYNASGFVKRAASLQITTGNNRGNVLTDHAHDTITATEYLRSEFKVILHYLLMFLWPFSISVEYDWKLSSSFFAPDSFFPFLALATLYSFVLYLAFKKKHPFFTFGMLWFLIGVAPRSSIIPSPELICDYKTYTASAGWFFVISIVLISGLTYLFEKIHMIPSWFFKPHTQLAILTLVLLPFGYGAMNRNIVWSTPVEFWSDIVKKAPKKARGHNNLGVALSEDGNFDDAIPHYLEAIRLDRFYSDPWSNLAVAYSVKGETDKAIAALRQAIRIFPHYPEAYNNLGTLMLKKKNYDAAEKILNVAIRLRPYYGKAFYNLGRLHMEKNDEETAWTYFKKATEGDLDTLEGFFTLGQVSLKLKKFEEAARAFEFALARGPNASHEQKIQIMFNLANSCFMSKQYEKAEQLFTHLTRISPHDHRYLYNLGETLYAKQDYEKALSIYEKIRTMPNAMPQVQLRYAHCLAKLDKLSEAKKELTELLNRPNVPEDVKKVVQNEIGRITVQEKINAGNRTFTMKDLQQAFNTTPPDKK